MVEMAKGASDAGGADELWRKVRWGAVYAAK
jgi:hypothetical protein